MAPKLLDRVRRSRTTVTPGGRRLTPPPTFPGGGGAAYIRPRPRGEKALLEALRVLNEDSDARNAALKAATLIDLGDYYLVGDQFDKALPRYQEGWRQLVASGSGTVALSDPVSTPLRAPSDSWVAVRRRPMRRPRPNTMSSSNTPSRRMVRAENVHTIKSDVIGATERSVMAAAVLRKARFRPRFVDGEPVSAAGVRVRQLVYARDPGEYRSPTASGAPTSR